MHHLCIRSDVFAEKCWCINVGRNTRLNKRKQWTQAVRSPKGCKDPHPETCRLDIALQWRHFEGILPKGPYLPCVSMSIITGNWTICSHIVEDDMKQTPKFRITGPSRETTGNGWTPFPKTSYAKRVSMSQCRHDKQRWLQSLQLKAVVQPSTYHNFKINSCVVVRMWLSGYLLISPGILIALHSHLF